jgi:hypothetical protein
MSPVTPIINTNFYGFDYYEVAYTCVGVQYPVLGDVIFPNITFSKAPYQELIANISVKDCPTPQTVDQLFTTSLSSRSTITINDIRANNIIADNIGIQFYTTNWEDSLILCDEINNAHTLNISIDGSYATAEQLELAKEQNWDTWWNTLLSMKVDLTDYFQMGDTQLYSGGSKRDSLNLVGRLIVPSHTIVSRSGVTTISAGDIFNACSNNYTISIGYEAFTQYFESPYGSCCIIQNDMQKNWTISTSMSSPYNITITPLHMNDTNGQILLNIPSKFFDDIRSNPSLLNQQFTLQWTINLTVQGDCLANAMVDKYINTLYPYSNQGQLYYQPGCGIIFNNAQEYASTILATLDTMKTTIRSLFSTTYNCYVRLLSQTDMYGDIIIGKGRFYNHHGSECSFLLKQVLRPIINVPTSNETTKGLTLPNSNAVVPTIQTSTIIPTTLAPNISPTTFSNLFKKTGNKLCQVLPTNLKYK